MSGGTRRLAKRLLAHGLMRTGGWELALRRWARRDRAIVLTYHRVLEKWEPMLDYSQSGMVVTAPTFERQLTFLERHFDIVPLGALLDHASGCRPGRRPRCVLTFDDGWRDNYDVAFPILRRRDLPATIFLTTDFIGTGRVFWHTDLIYLLMRGEPSQYAGAGGATLAPYPPVVQESFRRWAGLRGAVGAADVDAVVETIKATCEEAIIERLIDSLASAMGLCRPFWPERRFFLDWEQVREMAANGFEIGSHGLSHRILTLLPGHEATQELTRSKLELEHRLAREVWHFAFPNDNANAALIASAARAGYRSVCTGDGVEEAAPPGIRVLRRVNMFEGICLDGVSAEDAVLGLHLLRAPKSRSA